MHHKKRRKKLSSLLASKYVVKQLGMSLKFYIEKFCKKKKKMFKLKMIPIGTIIIFKEIMFV